MFQIPFGIFCLVKEKLDIPLKKRQQIFIRHSHLWVKKKSRQKAGLEYNLEK